MTAKRDKEFRDVAAKYTSGTQAKGLCEFMSHDAFLRQHKEREETDGRRVVSALFLHMGKTIELMRRLREQEEKTSGAEQEAPELA